MPDRVVGHYRIEQLAGEGGAGQVFRARDLSLDRSVALKFLRPELAAETEALDRFRQEARLAATLDDAHICTVHAIDRDAEGSWYIVMNWYDGGTLDQRIADGPVAPAEALRWARQAALGLAEAHRHGVVHRDVKPANLILDDRGDLRILDFGVARLQDTARRTRVGSLTGTVAYMAPEQARGEEGSAASDIWAVGVVLYEMLTGRLPFRGDYEAALLFDIVHGTAAPLPAELGSLRAPCQAIVDRCLAKDPAARYASAAELAADLAAAGGDRPQPRPVRRRRTAAVAAVAAVILVAVAAGVRFGPELRASLARRQSSRGVTVLPVVFGDGERDLAALGAGYGWFLADRLSLLEHRTGAFWIVPPGEVEAYGIGGEAEALELLGTFHTISGHGRLDGSMLTIDLTFNDPDRDRREMRRFSDDLANLRTWQQTVPAWLAGVLDERFVAAPPTEFSDGCTTVPAAFLAWLEGVGTVWSRAAGGDTGVLAHGIDLLARAVAEDSSYVRAHADWSWASYRREAGDDAAAGPRVLARLEAAAARDERSVWPPLYAARYLRGQGDDAEAVDLYGRVLAVDPANHAALTGKAEALAALGRNDEAAAAFTEALRRRPGFGPLLAQVAVFWYHQADYARAAAVAEEAARVLPNNYRTHLILGAARFELGDYDGATAAFHRSIACRATANPYLNLGTIAYYEGRYADAADEYRRALDLRRDRQSWKLLGEALRWQPGQQDSSRAAYGRAIRLAQEELAVRPGDRDLRAELATYCTAAGRLGQARELVAGFEDVPAPALSCDGMFYLSVAYEDLGRRQEALTWLERAFACGLPRDRPARYPGFRNLRADPRYRDLVRRYGGTS